MSICRYGKLGDPTGWPGIVIDAANVSDVYMYENTGGFIVCQNCLLGGSQEFARGEVIAGVRLFSYAAAHEHLLEHKRVGHSVPEYALDSTKNNADNGEQIGH